MTKIEKSLTRSVLTTIVGTAFPPIAALVTAPILAQGLGVEARGQVAAAQAAALLTVSVTTFGLPEALTYFVARGTRRNVAAYRSIAGFTTVIGCGAIAIVFFLSGWLSAGSGETSYLIRIAAISIIPSLLLGLIRGHAAGQELWGRIAAERILGSTARMVGAIALFAGGALTPMSATVLIVFSPLLGVIPYLIRPRARPPAIEPPPALREIASYSTRVWAGSVSGILLMRIDQVLLVPVAGARELGLYAVAVAISEVPLIVNSAVRDVSFARQSSNFDVPSLTQAARVSAMLTALVSLGIAAVAPFAVPVLFGGEFRDAIPVLWVLLLAVVVGTPGSIAGAGLSALGRPGLRSATLAIATPINVVALLALAPQLGATGAAVATVVGNLTSSNLAIHWFNKTSKSSWKQFYLLERSDFRAVVRVLRSYRHAAQT